MNKQSPLFLIIISIIFVFSNCEKEEENNAPTCKIINPSAGAKIPKDTTVTISVEAEDENGNLKEVRFYLDDTDLGSVNSPPYNYVWSLDDIDPGMHNLKAEAIDEKGANAEDNIQVSVGSSPDAAFSADSTAIVINTKVNFYDESNGEPIDWQWNFGDGNTSSEQDPSHTYSTKGTYTVKLTVSNEYGKDTEIKEDYITVGTAPTAAFKADKTETEVGETIYFSDQSNGNPESWQWNFGDGNKSSEQNPSHIYSSVGTYTVELIVSNKYGEDLETKTDYITVISGENETGTFTDFRDGQVYEWVKIGDQVWMAENLNYDQSGYGNDWCYYEDYAFYCDTYGRLYDWTALMQGSPSSNRNPSEVQGVCPDGWHVPSDKEWKDLINYVKNDGHSGKEGSTLKSRSGWKGYGDGTDDYGFNALPGGYRHSRFDYFAGRRSDGYWWTSTEYSSTDAWSRHMNYNSDSVDRSHYEGSKAHAFSVRCVKDD